MESSNRYTSLFLLLLFIILAVPSCGPKPEEIVQTFVTGEISRRHVEINGKKEGKMTEYYIDGKPQFLKTFSAGKMDGYIRKWNENDSIIYEARYANDTLVEVKGVVLRSDTLTEKK